MEQKCGPVGLFQYPLIRQNKTKKKYCKEAFSVYQDNRGPVQIMSN